MLPAFIIDQIHRERERERTPERPALYEQIPLEPPPPPPEDAGARLPDDGTLIVDFTIDITI